MKPIIIADDEILICNLYKRLIKKRLIDLEIETVCNGENLVSSVKNGNYGLILTDNDMGSGIKGLEAIKQIREFNPEIPIIFASGYDVRDKALDAGANLAYVKPIRLDEITDIINKYCLE